LALLGRRQCRAHLNRSDAASEKPAQMVGIGGLMTIVAVVAALVPAAITEGIL